jgi:hypothetical protein
LLCHHAPYLECFPESSETASWTLRTSEVSSPTLYPALPISFAAFPRSFTVEPFGFGMLSFGFGMLIVEPIPESGPFRRLPLPLSATPPARPSSAAPPAIAGAFTLAPTLDAVERDGPVAVAPERAPLVLALPVGRVRDRFEVERLPLEAAFVPRPDDELFEREPLEPPLVERVLDVRLFVVVWAMLLASPWFLIRCLDAYPVRAYGISGDRTACERSTARTARRALP